MHDDAPFRGGRSIGAGRARHRRGRSRSIPPQRRGPDAAVFGDCGASLGRTQHNSALSACLEPAPESPREHGGRRLAHDPDATTTPYPLRSERVGATLRFDPLLVRSESDAKRSQQTARSAVVLILPARPDRRGKRSRHLREFESSASPFNERTMEGRSPAVLEDDDEGEPDGRRLRRE